MEIHKLYTDFWEKLGTYLSSDDLYSFMLTCKQAYKACQRYSLRTKMSYPMLYPWRLTYEQRQVIKQMESKQQRFKLIHGDVGSGKTIVSTAYAIKNYISDPESKIVMCGPPNLIKMWWSTINKYFGIEPCVLHATNPKYNPKTSWDNKPTEKFILVSYKLLSFNDRGWFDSTKDLLIIDEAHHSTGVKYKLFHETIGLSATTTKANGMSNGIKFLIKDYGLNIEECTYTLDKNIIARKLPPIKYYPYLLKTNERVTNGCKHAIKYDKKGEYDLFNIPEISKYISHPEIFDLCDTFTAGYIMMGRKSFRVERGNETLYKECWKSLSDLNHKEQKKKMLEMATFDIKKLGVTYPKYVQAYHIVKNANDSGEKVLLFDNSVTYLPFLHQFLSLYGINSYLFSTHYEVTSRQKQLTKFKEDKKPGVLLSSITMLGEGQNITEATQVIFFGQNMDHTKYYQGIGRLWRYPQSKTVKVHLLFGNKFDQAIYEHACGTVDLKALDWQKLL